MANKNNNWNEIFRPKHIDELICSNKRYLIKAINNLETIPHIILYDTKSFGVGKTTFALLLKNKYQDDFHTFDGTDKVNSEAIRDKIKSLATTKSLFLDKRKIIFIDEFDSINKIGFVWLQNIMEKYSYNVLFILATNDLIPIPGAIKSRCYKIDFSKPDKKEIYDRLEYICKKTKIEYNKQSLNRIIKEKYPSIRDMIIDLQFGITNEKLTRTGTIEYICDDKIWRYYVQNHNFNRILTYVKKHPFNYYEIIQGMNIPIKINKRKLITNELKILFDKYIKKLKREFESEYIFNQFLREFEKLIMNSEEVNKK